MHNRQTWKSELSEGCICLFLALDGLLESLFILVSSELYLVPSQESKTELFCKLLSQIVPS